MTSWVVVDSGVALATALSEPFTARAVARFTIWEQQNVQLAAPAQFQYEIVSVLRNRVFRRLLMADEAVLLRDQLLARPVDLLMDQALIKRAYDLATQYNRPTVYDAQYLAVAERLKCEFWTLDERLFNAVRQELTWVRWIGESA